MKSLYLRIYLTVVAVLLAFALIGGWLAHRQIEREREQAEQAQDERLQAMADLLERALPPADAPAFEQAHALRRWSLQLRMPLALESATGERLASTPRFERRQELGEGSPPKVLTLSDGRRLLVLRPWRPRAGLPPVFGPLFERAHVLGLLFVLLFIGVALGAYPVVRRLTRRLETLKRGVERFGAGELQHRVAVDGKDEVAALAQSFNQSAERVSALVRAHQSLVANASHELRSPLARLKMALALRDETGPNPRLDQEVARNLAELDGLIEELLMSARLEASAPQRQRVDLLGLAAEECAQAGLALESELPEAAVQGEERLLRRALRNLLENAKRYGGSEQDLELCRRGTWLDVRVRDRGPGVPPELTERIFEPFFRLPGHAEVAGGVGLGLSLVRQIALAHQGSVRCEPRPGGGSVFVLSLPAA
ncbi:HAMP domain-containing sensor histidine kinase [Inhella proteolytica]|uniref:histidine kinase n=1 Tax=Inhella proteolytica TaxID=2795029 RepID=A0A931IZ98_9BURK|nr:ATP-binding protein [Inhella proteolytica]MBH9575783.1 HAMP domain-containing protein [Inhella proteolytica]